MYRNFRSIKTRFILTIFATVFFFLAAMLIMSYSTLKQSALRNAEELSHTVLMQTDMRIDSFFEEVEDLAVSLSGYPSFYNVRPREMKPIILSTVNARSDHIRAIYLGTTDGKMYEWGIGEGFIDNSPILEPGYDPRERPWYTKATDSGEFIISEPYKYASVEAMGITGAIPVYSRNGIFVGVLGIDIMLDDLELMMKELDLGWDGRLILLNRNNRMIINQFNGDDIKTLGMKKFELFDEGKIDECRSGAIISPRGYDEKFYVECKENRMTGWKLMTALPLGAIMAHTIDSIEFIAFIDVLLMLLLMVVLSYLSNSMMINPLEDTINVIRRLEAGEGNARLEESRSDEFGILARQFNRLIDTVRDNSRSLEEKVQERTRELLNLQKENIRLRIIEEKERIYGYLHDSLGARLTNIFISNSVARTAAEKDPATLQDMLSRIESNTEQAIEDLREILHTSETDKRRIIDFTRLVRANILKNLELRNIRLHTSASSPEELNNLGRGIRFEIEKILQELVNNVLKHSGADRVDLVLEVRGPLVFLKFSDNGCGGAKEDMAGASFGLSNIRKRVKNLGGLFSLISPPGEGTTVEISIPTGEKVSEYD